MSRYIILKDLLYEINKQLRDTEEELRDYIYIPKVQQFLLGRKNDLKEFERLVRGYRDNESNFKICSDLKGNSRSKIYGEICLNGKEYFKIPKYIKELIDEETSVEVFFEPLNYDEGKEINFDASFAIPDELDPETFDRLYN